MDESSGTTTRRDRGPIRRILLVGFMGSGKTSVGRAVAAALGWEFLDFDRAIERRAGRTVPEIFDRDGEETFRSLEAEVGDRLLERERVVLASGGGWPAARGRIDAVGAGTLTIWLRVSPEAAVERVRSRGPDGPDALRRPLLETADPVATARELLEAREPYYRKADWEMDTEERAPREIARAVVRRLDRQRRLS